MVFNRDGMDIRYTALHQARISGKFDFPSIPSIKGFVSFSLNLPLFLSSSVSRQIYTAVAECLRYITISAPLTWVLTFKVKFYVQKCSTITIITLFCADKIQHFSDTNSDLSSSESLFQPPFNISSHICIANFKTIISFMNISFAHQVSKAERPCFKWI